MLKRCERQDANGRVLHHFRMLLRDEDSNEICRFAIVTVASDEALSEAGVENVANLLVPKGLQSLEK